MYTYILLPFILYLSFRKPAKLLVFTVITYMTLYLFVLGSLRLITAITILLLMLYFARYQKTRIVTKEKFPFKISFLFCLSSYIITLFVGKNIHLKLLLDGISEYILVFLMWTCYRATPENNKFFLKILIGYMVVLCLYGSYEALTGNNQFIDSLIASGRLRDVYSYDNIDRTGLHRTKSLTIWCESYGTICAISLFCLFNLYFQKVIKSSLLFFVLMGLIMFGILSSNSRTMVVTAAIMLISLFPYMYKNKKLFVIFSLFICCFIYWGGNIVFKVFGSIINHEDVGGSSMDMRMSQFDTVLYVVSNNFWFGNGFNTISDAIKNNPTLLGAESIIFTVFIERGIFGIISVLILWIDILIYLIRNKEFWLIPLLLGYVFDKVATLSAGFNESYILLFIILLVRLRQSMNNCTKYLL